MIIVLQINSNKLNTLLNPTSFYILNLSLSINLKSGSLLTLWHIFHHFSRVCQFSGLSSQSPRSPTDMVTASPCSYSAFLSRNCQVRDERSKFHSQAVKGYSTVEKWENVIIYRNSKLTIQNMLSTKVPVKFHNSCLFVHYSVSDEFMPVCALQYQL